MEGVPKVSVSGRESQDQPGHHRHKGSKPIEMMTPKGKQRESIKSLRGQDVRMHLPPIENYEKQLEFP